MFTKILQKLFGNENKRKIEKYNHIVAKVNEHEALFEKYDREKFLAKTKEWQEIIAKDKNAFKNIMPEAMAAVREAAKRTLGQRHFDVQIIGGLALYEQSIAEMKTGEGKTLVATLPVYLTALQKKSVHIVTVNDYLAARDTKWMEPIYQYLGIQVGCITSQTEDQNRKQQYEKDVVYGTNNEFAFDYLRDNMKPRAKDMVQHEHHFAIIDEVDSILIDEARTPLIISGMAKQTNELYQKINRIIPKIEKKHYDMDEKTNSITFNEQGLEKLEQLLEENKLLKEGSLYDSGNVSLMHYSNQLLRAHKMFQKEKDYIVKNSKIVIIDEFTGRMMQGRRYSDGLHQALEAKENIPIQQENVTLASITFQNYFRMYQKLAGMTGTAVTEADEFNDIYKLQIVEVPTNETVRRTDHDDEIYRTNEEKLSAVVKYIKQANDKKQPVLVGTTSIEKSEKLSLILRKQHVKHQVLNARYHEQEASIIAQAGCPKAVTIATNMAGRGTDIQLGGNLQKIIEQYELNAKDEKIEQKKIDLIKEKFAKDRKEVIDAGGVCIIGTERHESRRTDNQLRGRAGRQGDPGETKFFLSLEDDLMRIFGSEKIDSIMGKLGVEKDHAISHRWISKAIEKAQKKVETNNFEIRKNLIKYDDVINYQRKIIFEQRKHIIDSVNIVSMVADMNQNVVEQIVDEVVGDNIYKEKWNIELLKAKCLDIFNIKPEVITEWMEEEGLDKEDLKNHTFMEASDNVARKAAELGPNTMRKIEKSVLLDIVDRQWQQNLQNLDYLRQAVGLHGYGQRDPLNEFKTEALIMFENMLLEIDTHFARTISHFQVQMQSQEYQQELQKTNSVDNEYNIFNNHENEIIRIPQDPSTWGKVKRNEKCPCESGKKYKHCHGSIADF